MGEFDFASWLDRPDPDDKAAETLDARGVDALLASLAAEARLARLTEEARKWPQPPSDAVTGVNPEPESALSAFPAPETPMAPPSRQPSVPPASRQPASHRPPSHQQPPSRQASESPSHQSPPLGGKPIARSDDLWANIPGAPRAAPTPAPTAPPTSPPISPSKESATRPVAAVAPAERQRPATAPPAGPGSTAAPANPAANVGRSRWRIDAPLFVGLAIFVLGVGTLVAWWVIARAPEPGRTSTVDQVTLNVTRCDSEGATAIVVNASPTEKQFDATVAFITASGEPRRIVVPLQLVSGAQQTMQIPFVSGPNGPGELRCTGALANVTTPN